MYVWSYIFIKVYNSTELGPIPCSLLELLRGFVLFLARLSF